MTEERMALLEFVGKSGEPDFLRDLLQCTVQRLMECEVEGRCRAARHERTEDRTNSRNGYRERQWQTRVGALELKIPKLRQGTYYPSFLSYPPGRDRCPKTRVIFAGRRSAPPRSHRPHRGDRPPGRLPWGEDGGSIIPPFLGPIWPCSRPTRPNDVDIERPRLPKERSTMRC